MPNDFQPYFTGTASGVISEVVPTSATTFAVTISEVSGFGDVGITLIDNSSIHDADGNTLVNPATAFTEQTTWAAGVGNHAIAPVAADIDGDGKLDLVLADN